MSFSDEMMRDGRIRHSGIATHGPRQDTRTSNSYHQQSSASEVDLQAQVIPPHDHSTSASVIAANMSDGDVEVEAPQAAYPVLPKEVMQEIGSTKLFNKWSYEDVEIRDISLTYVHHQLFDIRKTTGSRRA